jgi:hypothetical protein
LLIRVHIDGPLKCLLIKVYSWMRLIKNALKQIQGARIKRILPVLPVMLLQMMIKGMSCVMNIQLIVCNIMTWQGNDRASPMDEFAMQNIRVRSMTTLIDGRISSLASGSHGQRIVVEEDAKMEGLTDMIIGSEKIIEGLGNVIKSRKRDFALITAHAKKRIVDCRGSKGFGSPMKGMARRTLDIHLSKGMNLPSRIKR